MKQKSEQMPVRTQFTLVASIFGLILLWAGALGGSQQGTHPSEMVRYAIVLTEKVQYAIALTYTGVFLWFVTRWFYRNVTRADVEDWENKSFLCAIGIILTIIGIGLLVWQANVNISSLGWWR